MNSELKPCPFCGEQPKVVEDVSVSWVVCDNENCMVYARTLLKKTRGEAIEVWNRRIERKGKQVMTERNDGLMPPFTAHCSECGVQWGYTPNYCPNCGAKIKAE